MEKLIYILLIGKCSNYNWRLRFINIMYPAKAALYKHQRQSTNIRTFTKGGIYALPCQPHCMSGLMAYRCINAGYACVLYSYMIGHKSSKIEYLRMHQLCKPNKTIPNWYLSEARLHQNKKDNQTIHRINLYVENCNTIHRFFKNSFKNNDHKTSQF